MRFTVSRAVGVCAVLLMVGALASPPAQAHKKSGHPRSAPRRPTQTQAQVGKSAAPRLARVEVHTHYTKPADNINSFDCNGLVATPSQPDCGFHFIGPATFTGTMYGDVWYDNYGMFQPDGTLRYKGPDYIIGGVEGCGKGTFTIDDSDGKIDFTKFDPQTNSWPGQNNWYLRKGSGIGELTNLVDGAGVNNWRLYLDGNLHLVDRSGEGDVTGSITCLR